MKTYPLFKVHVPTDEALAGIQEVFKSGFINEGTEVTKLTDELKRFLGAQNLILVNSCTSALTLALRLSGVHPDDDVVTTPMTCVATNTPIVTSHAHIVWADIDRLNGMIDPDDVVNRITPKTKAVIAVAWAGTPPHLDRLQAVCKERNVKLILDAAHAFGAEYQGRPVHESADFTCYSFQAIKHFTTGDGGALICRDDEHHRRSKALKWFGLDREAAKDAQGNWKGQQWDAEIHEAGYKFNMNNVAAAIGLAQVKHAEKVLGAHRANAALYDQLFKGHESVYAAAHPFGGRSSHWVYTMRVSKDHPHVKRDELLKKLNAEGIMAGVVHVPNDNYVAFGGYKTDLPGVREFAENQFSLPCGWWLDEKDVRHIAKRVKELTK